MEKIDAAYNAFINITSEIEDYSHSMYSEQDTRIKIIDRILIEVLGYGYGEILTERKAGRGFIDYKISIKGLPRLVIEAKKDGVNFNIDQSYSGRSFNLNGPVFRDNTIKEGLEQAIYYSAFKGIELACLTNGKTWIIFRSNRLADGKDVFDGKGFVFSTLEAIRKEFKLFYELLSPEGIDDLKYRALLQEAEGDEIRVKDFSKSLVHEDSINVVERNQYSHDFDRVMTEFFSKLSGDSDPDMLLECFVETTESNLAEKELIRISGDLVNRIKSLETKEGELLKEMIERVKITNRHEFVILIGGKGAGKSTFIDRFFKFILSEKLKHECIIIRINVGESDGNISSIIDWLNQALLEECEKILYNGKPTYEQIVGMFYFEYERLSEGSWRGIYEKDKEQFKIDFGKRIEDRRENRPNEYIKRMIGDITKNRSKVPCIIFDNTDHFGIDFQETVFQYARSIYEKEICLVIVPITDKTSWQLSKHGAIQSFENEALFLPTPPPKKIIEKRIEFIEKRLNIEKETKGTYFLSRGIKLKIDSIEKFVKYLQGVLLRNEKVSKWIGNFSNMDIRRTLDLAKDMIASPHLSIDDFLRAYTFNKKNNFEADHPIKLNKVKTALVKTIYNCYPINNHKYIQNVFYLTGNINTSPLVSLRILQVLQDRRSDRHEDNFLATDQLLDYFSAMGIDRSITMKHLDFMLKKGLIISYDPTILSIYESKKVELTPSGFEHYLWALNDNDYLYFMLEVTPIVDKSTYNYLEQSYDFWQERNKCMIAFLDHLEKEDNLYCHIPEHPSYEGQNLIFQRFEWRRTLMKRWISQRNNW